MDGKQVSKIRQRVIASAAARKKNNSLYGTENENCQSFSQDQNPDFGMFNFL